jgi:hypothetical protein
METLWILLAAIVSYLTLWTYFDACRQRDAYQTGLGPRGLPPNAWAALVFFFAPIAVPLYLKAKDALAFESSPRTGAPPVFESRGLNLYGWLGLPCFLGAAGWLIWEKETLLAALALVMAAVTAFGGRTIRSTDRALKVELPAGAAWEQVGFRPLPREEDQADHDEEEVVVNLDRLAPPPSRPGPAAFPPPAPAPFPPSPVAPPAAFRPVAPPPAAAPPASPVFAAPRPPAAPAQSSVRISDIVWAASEDSFGDGDAGEPEPRGAGASPHATVAADPALFRQLGGIFAPPGAAPAPRLPPSPIPPPLSPSAAAAPPSPRPNPQPAAPGFAPLVPPSRSPSAPAAGPAAALPPRPAPPLAGAYAASSSSESKLPLILAAALALVLLVAGGWFFLRRQPQPAGDPVAAPPETPAMTQEEPATAPKPVPAAPPPQAPQPSDQLAAAKAWMPVYLDYFGLLGQTLDEIDFEGFSPDRCAQLRSSLERVGEMPPAPDEQLHFELSACVLLMSYLPEDCGKRDVGSWCSHLTEARLCVHEVQQNIEAKWGLPGLFEFQISDTEPRSTSSMSGRCIADQIEARTREVQQ